MSPLSSMITWQLCILSAATIRSCRPPRDSQILLLLAKFRYWAKIGPVWKSSDSSRVWLLFSPTKSQHSGRKTNYSEQWTSFRTILGHILGYPHLCSFLFGLFHQALQLGEIIFHVTGHGHLAHGHTALAICGHGSTDLGKQIHRTEQSEIIVRCHLWFDSFNSIKNNNIATRDFNWIRKTRIYRCTGHLEDSNCLCVKLQTVIYHIPSYSCRWASCIVT